MKWLVTRPTAPARLRTIIRNALVATVLGVTAFFAYRYIMFPDMTRSTTTGLRGAGFVLPLLVLLVGAVRLTDCPWIGVAIPFAMAIAMEYIARHSGTNSDGLEGVGEFMLVIGGLCVVFGVTQTVRLGWTGTTPHAEGLGSDTSST